MKFGNPASSSKRYSVVAQDGDAFVGSATGLTDDNQQHFFLTDLFINENYRSEGLGMRLLDRLESIIKEKGVRVIWTWTAEFEAPMFYEKQGYKEFYEMKNYYKSGHSRIGFIKELK